MSQTGSRLTCYRCASGFISQQSGNVDCKKCGHSISVHRARLCYIGNNSNLRKLADGPKSSTEVEIGSIHAGREYVEKLSIRHSQYSTGTFTPIYYLPGDERHAMRKFIEVNYDTLREYVGSGRSFKLFKQHWPDYMWQMLEEQWMLAGHSGIEDLW